MSEVILCQVTFELLRLAKQKSFISMLHNKENYLTELFLIGSFVELLLKILSLRQHGIVFNNAFDGLLADFSVGHSARIPTAITSQCVCQQVSFKEPGLLGYR